MRIILASRSPRRGELLKRIIPHFEVIPSNFDENLIAENDPIEFVKKVAEAKAMDAAKQINEGVVIISADTIVVIGQKIIGKPKDDNDAFNILSLASGREQSVITGFCLINTQSDKKIVDYEESIVKMKKMLPEEILGYIATGEGRDKAGAYAIQGRADRFIEYIKGDYYNIMGLPIKKIKNILQKIK